MSSRVLTICYTFRYLDSSYRNINVPLIKLEEKWVEKLGFSIGKKIKVSEKPGRITLSFVKED